MLQKLLARTRNKLERLSLLKTLALSYIWASGKSIHVALRYSNIRVVFFTDLTLGSKFFMSCKRSSLFRRSVADGEKGFVGLAAGKETLKKFCKKKIIGKEQQ